MSNTYAVALPKDSAKFASLEYMLKMSLQGHPCSDLHIWEVDNPNAHVTFDRRCSSMLTLLCWVDCGSLDAANQMDDVCRRGFVFPADGRGLSFKHGNVTLDDSEERFDAYDAEEGDKDKGKQHHFYIFADVGVGRPYIIDAVTASDPDGRSRPAGYDSLYVSQKQLDGNDDGFISAEEYEAIAAHDGRDAGKYEHEYIVTDPAQVLPRYVFRFAADLKPKAEEENNDPLKVYDRYDFFDPVLYKPVSLRDKMIGSHSMGEAATHKLINLPDAYNAAIVESKKVDPLVQRKKNQILEELNNIDTKLRDINMNFASVEEELYGILKSTLSKLKEEVNCKTKILLSTELEFRRQLEQLANAEQWLDRSRVELPQTDFLQAWKHHTELTANMCAAVSLETSVLKDLKADLRVEGSLDVVSASGEALLSAAPAPPGGGGPGVSALLRGGLPAGSTDFRQQLFSDAAAGATATTGTTKRTLMSQHAGDNLRTVSQTHSVNSIERLAPSSLGGSIPASGGIPYQSPNFLSSTESNRDNDLWTSSLERSMGLGGGGGGPKPPPASSSPYDSGGGGGNQFSVPSLYTVQAPQPMMPPNPANVQNYQPARVMAQVSQRFPQLSLTALADRKMKQLTVQPNDAMIFRGSAIVNPAEARTLYYSIPFISTLPATNLVFSTRMHERSIRSLVSNVANVMSPTMVIVRSGEYVFGGYATDAWKFNGERAGNPKGFLFSVTLDCKIPYHGRQKDMQSGALGPMSARKHDCMWSGADHMSFGIKDLCLRGDFRSCTSELEHSYSIGLETGSPEARSFIAGSNVFTADEIEVWAVST